MSILAVFIGGGLGSLARYGLSVRFPYEVGTIPVGTLSANVLSSLILGLLMAYTLKSDPSTVFKLLLMVGFCGGFSTFSTFSKEAFDMLQAGHTSLAFGYVLSSCLLGILCIFLGWKVGSSLF